MKIVCVGVNQKKRHKFRFFFFVFWPYRLVEMLYHYYCYYFLFPPRLGLRYWSSIGKRLRDTTRTAGLLRKHHQQPLEMQVLWRDIVSNRAPSHIASVSG